MGIEEQFRIDRAQPGSPADAHTAGAAGTPETSEFRRMLEKLEAVARPAHKPGADTQQSEDADLDKLHDAMRKADDDYAAIMDLRRRIEEAYRSSQS